MDKDVEYNRYNNLSESKINGLEIEKDIILLDGSNAYPEYLKSPYLFYESLLESLISKNTKILDLCCGDGIHTIFLAKLSLDVTAIDIAENSIKLAKIRQIKSGLSHIKFIVSDAENLPFTNNEKFDLITCVGSLSYIEIEPFILSIKNLLSDNGYFICVDSFNHNPIYKLNRYIHYLKKERSYSTLIRMPNLKTIDVFKKNFNSTDIKFFGIFAFLGKILTVIIGNKKAKIVIDKLDRIFSFLRRYSFKVVIISKK